MPDLQLEPGNGSATNWWEHPYAALRSRFPTATDSVAFAIYTFQTDPSISLDDLKARGLMHCVRITAHSVNAAQRLMLGVKAPERKRTAPSPAEEAPEPAIHAVLAELRASETPRPPRPKRGRRPHVDVADLVVEAVEKLRRDREAEAERLRSAIREPLAMLKTVVG